MKVIWLLTILAVAAATPIEKKEDTRIHGENGWYVPQLDGSAQWMDKDEWEAKVDEMEMIEGRGLTTTPVSFNLYTNSNPNKGQKISASDSAISNSNFNANNPTRFVIHGWTQSKYSSMNGKIRSAFFSQGNFNVIYVDWARARSVDYASSVLAVPAVGKKVANLIDFLHQNHGMSLDTLTVIGHSLGAHVAGYAGKNVQSGQIHSIVGLDPALPLFSYNKPNKRLANTDAYYVESIQTDGGQLGFLQPIGKGAFYPNGGKTQPGCPLDVTGACSHGRSVSYYAEAVQQNDFPSMQCANYNDATNKACGSTYSSVRMGANSNAYVANGDFYVPVKSKSPYGMGS